MSDTFVADELASQPDTWRAAVLRERAGRFAVALAGRKGLDPDNPRSLTRSVIPT